MSNHYGVFVALGSNQGDRWRYLALGRRELDRIRCTMVLKAGRIEETDPIGNHNQPQFLNQMIFLETCLEPLELLRECQRIERLAGRTRPFKWAPRTLDLDIVIFASMTINLPDLIIPHPELPNRPFWQRQMDEIMTGRRGLGPVSPDALDDATG